MLSVEELCPVLCPPVGVISDRFPEYGLLIIQKPKQNLLMSRLQSK